MLRVGITEPRRKHTLSDENQICLQSLSGDDMAWVSDMEFSIDNATFKSGYHHQNEIAISNEGVLLNENELLFSQSVLALNHEGNCLEFGNPSPPLFQKMERGFGICQFCQSH